jgi:hypothetical protein
MQGFPERQMEFASYVGTPCRFGAGGFYVAKEIAEQVGERVCRVKA